MTYKTIYFVIFFKDIVCQKQTRERVEIGDGDSFTFKTQAGPNYKPNTNCKITYKVSKLTVLFI